MQVGKWHGFVINTISMTFQIPEKRVCKLKRLLNSTIQNKSSSYCELARIAGSIVSVVLAVRPISRLLTRQMYLAIESRSAWDHSFLFPPALPEELKFWFCNIEYFNGYSFRPPLDSSTVVFSKASDTAFGGFSTSLEGTVASSMFTIDDLSQNSTFHELKAIYYVLLSIVEHLKHNRVKIFTDKQSAARIVSVGSSKVHLQSMALSIFSAECTIGMVLGLTALKHYGTMKLRCKL